MIGIAEKSTALDTIDLNDGTISGFDLRHVCSDESSRHENARL